MKTWSYTPWNLRNAMRGCADVVDVGVEVPGKVQLGLKVLHARRRGGRMVTTWQQSRITDAYFQRELDRAVAAAGCDAVVEMGDIAPLDRPFFLYQDLSFDLLLDVREKHGVPLPFGLSRADIERRRERQRGIYEKATGVLAMSHWLARSLVELSGLPAEKVHVVHPGRSSRAADGAAAGPVSLPVRDRPRRRLLLVGRGSFTGKGGDLTLAALEILRREVDPEITLTIAGPPTWPLETPVPEGVTFLGSVPTEEVARLFDTHDLFVMPSRLEGFGIVFVEAMSRGLPCVGRDAYAMPEIITSGETGGLLSGDDPAELAHLVATILDDDDVYARCAQRAPEVASWFTWERAGRQVVDVVSGALGATVPGSA
jgi:glycosyltransferase involved in cell wall biosynthesis